MMTRLCCDVLKVLKGRSLVTAESCTGGGIGAALTAIPGSSETYKGGVVCYTNWVKENVLGVDPAVLNENGAVSAPVAQMMASGARLRLQSDIAVSVTGLAGPGGDDYGNTVGTVFIGYSNAISTTSREYHFSGDRESVRQQAVLAALNLILEKENQNI